MKRALAAAVLLAVAACGTTVPVSEQRATGLTSFPEAERPVVAGTANVPGGALPDVGGGATAPAPVGSRSAPSGIPGPRGASPDAAAARARGDVVVGINYSDDYEATMSAMGFSGLSTGNIPALATALADGINTSGGLAGRKIRLVFHNGSTAQSQSNPSAAAQAVCADFLQDHRVALAITTIAVVNDCFLQARVPAVQYGTITPVGTDQEFLEARGPYLYEPSAFLAEDLYPLWMERLAAQGYLPSGARIGLLWGDEPSEQRQAKLTLRLLRDRGFTQVQTYEYSTSSATDGAAGIASSVLAFQQNRVDHVIGLDGNIGLFMLQAEQQQYRPRYALNTYAGPTSVQVTVAPAAQLRGTVGVGWQPVNDVDSAHDDLRSAGRAACDKAIARTGQSLSGSALFIAYSLCDAFTILTTGAGRTGSVTGPDLRAGVSRLGTSFPTALNLLGAYSARSSAGASGVRDLKYDETCSCFRYASKEIHQP